VLAIFLSGPIGAGKSTLGRALADALDGNFIEGDEHSARGRPWYCSTLSTAQSIERSITSFALNGRPTVIARPLRCIDYTYYYRRLTNHHIRMVVVTLVASYDATVASNRGRQFSIDERARIRAMIEEGYDRRPFSDFVLETDRDNIGTTLGKLIAQLSTRRE
jgi:cytidylate kinase